MTAIIYTHPPDYLMAGISARVLAARGVEVVLAIHEDAPPLACEFAKVVRTSFDRQGNLNGREFILGHLRLMQQHASGGYTIKLDSDTLLIDPDRLLSGREESAVGVYVSGMNGMQGCCYALKTSDLPAIIEVAEIWKTHGLMMEDKTIGQIAAAIGSVHLPTWGKDADLYARHNQAKGHEWHRENHAVIVFDARPESDRRDIALQMKSFL